MRSKIADKTKVLSQQKRSVIIITALLCVVFLALMINWIATPERSVSSYCEVYGKEKTRLASLPGNTYSSKVFKHRLSDAGEFAKSFDKLEAVAPDDIKPDVRTLRLAYQTIYENPSGAMSASLGAISAEDSVKNWTDERCQNL
jgi:hypothetical protein